MMTTNEILDTVRELKKPFDVAKVKVRKQANMHLHYIDARDVMARLDATVGPLNWEDQYHEVMGRIVCTLKVRFGDECIEKAQQDYANAAGGDDNSDQEQLPPN